MMWNTASGVRDTMVSSKCEEVGSRKRVERKSDASGCAVGSLSNHLNVRHDASHGK